MSSLSVQSEVYNQWQKSYRRTVRWADRRHQQQSLWCRFRRSRILTRSDMYMSMVNGIEGFLNDRILDFEEALPGDKLNGLTHTPGYLPRLLPL